MTGRAEILAAAGDTAYARLMMSSAVTGYAADGALVWTSVGPWGPVGCAIGPCTALVASLLERGLLNVPHLHAPVGCPVDLPFLENWELRTLVGPPPPLVPGVFVEPVSDADAIEEVLALALPHTSSRPGDRGVRGWYGVRDADGSLLAVGADRSANGVGNLVGIAVRPSAWGKGFGSAVTAAMTARLHAEFGAVVLGVTVGNDRATALYDRLGFTDSLLRSSYDGPSVAATSAK